jgi:hypothetical protein
MMTRLRPDGPTRSIRQMRKQNSKLLPLVRCSDSSFAMSRRSKSVDLDMSIASWFACMDSYKTAVQIVGCSTVTSAVLCNHIMTIGKVIEQVSRNGGTYNKIVLVCSKLLFSAFVCMSHLIRLTTIGDDADGTSELG